MTQLDHYKCDCGREYDYEQIQEEYKALINSGARPKDTLRRVKGAWKRLNPVACPECRNRMSAIFRCPKCEKPCIEPEEPLLKETSPKNIPEGFVSCPNCEKEIELESLFSGDDGADKLQ